LPLIAIDCHRLPSIAIDCHRLPSIANRLSSHSADARHAHAQADSSAASTAIDGD